MVLALGSSSTASAQQYMHAILGKLIFYCYLAGSAVCLYGSSNGTYDVSLDSDLVNNVTAPGDGTLYCQDDLPTDVHYVNLTAHFPHAGQLLEFDYATVTYDFATG